MTTNIEKYDTIVEINSLFGNSINVLSEIETLQNKNLTRLTEEESLTDADVKQIIDMVVNSSRDNNSFTNAKNKMVAGLEALSKKIDAGEVLREPNANLKKLMSALNSGNKAVFGQSSSVLSAILSSSSQIKDEEQRNKFDSFMVLGILAMLGTFSPNGMMPKVVLTTILNIAASKYAGGA